MAKAAATLATLKGAPGADASTIYPSGTCSNVDREINVVNWLWILMMLIITFALGVCLGWFVHKWINLRSIALMTPDEAEPDPEVEELPDLEELETVDRENNGEIPKPNGSQLRLLR